MFPSEPDWEVTTLSWVEGHSLSVSLESELVGSPSGRGASVSVWAQGVLTRRLSMATQEAEAECELRPVGIRHHR